MKETRFIEQNKEKWLESENLLKHHAKDPEKLTTLFTQVIDDLSYSRTFYPNRSVRVYLNKIGREYFSIIYNHQKTHKNKFRDFWTDELPQVVIHCRKQLIISTIIFLISAGIGIFSAANDPEFTSSILGESYVAMTKENIEKGDPMAVYKKSHQVDMFLGITYNNLLVAFRTYVTGVFLSIGTIAILLYNGIMVGCFQFFFIERGLFVESALSIWLHGTLEISSIILAGGAGLTLGSGLVFPGTYSRLQAFQISAIRSLKLMLGITPIFVFAALIESFLTRYTETPDFVRLLLIIVSAVFIVGYFIVYPWRKSKTGFREPLKAARIQPTIREVPDIRRVKNNAELLRDGFVFYLKNIGTAFPWLAGASLLVAIAHYILAKDDLYLAFLYTEDVWWVSLLSDQLFALKTPNGLFIPINACAFSVVAFVTLRLLDRDADRRKNRRQTVIFLQTLAIFLILFSIIWQFGAWGVAITLLVFLPLLMWVYIQAHDRTNLFGGLGSAINLCSERFGFVLGLQLVLALLCFSFLLMLNAPLLYITLEVFQWQLTQESATAQAIIWIGEKWINLLAFYLGVPMLLAVSAYTYHSLNEIATAHFLKEQIATIGQKTKKR